MNFLIRKGKFTWQREKQHGFIGGMDSEVASLQRSVKQGDIEMGKDSMRTSTFSPYHIFIVRIDGKDYKVPHVMRDEEFEEIIRLNGGCLPSGIRAYHFTGVDQLLLNPVVERMPVLSVPVKALFTAKPLQPMKLKDKTRARSLMIKRKYGDFVLCEGKISDVFFQVDGKRRSIVTELKICPISLKEAQQYIRKHHRHCGPPKFHKFSVALVVAGEDEPVGIAVASTPKARVQMDGKTLEINRVCSDVRYADVCSKLYSLVVKAGRNMGYCRFLTYTLAEEDGVGIKAAGFRLDGMTENAPQGWNSQSRPRCTEKYPDGPKKRWVLDL